MIIQEGPENISAFVCETVVGAAAGGVTPVPEYYPMIREICDKYNVVWIADEIMAGVGRTGTFLAIEHWKVQPDLVVLAKGLSSGYAPLSAILVSDKVFKAFGDSKLPYIGGHTYNAHPVTAAVGLAVLDYMDQHGVIEGVAEKGHRLGEGLRAIAERHALVGDVRGLGLMWGLEFVRDKGSRAPFAFRHNIAMRVVDNAMQKGLIVYPVRGGCADGERGDGVFDLPAANHQPRGDRLSRPYAGRIHRRGFRRSKRPDMIIAHGDNAPGNGGRRAIQAYVEGAALSAAAPWFGITGCRF